MKPALLHAHPSGIFPVMEFPGPKFIRKKELLAFCSLFISRNISLRKLSWTARDRCTCNFKAAKTFLVSATLSLLTDQVGLLGTLLGFREFGVLLEGSGVALVQY